MSGERQILGELLDEFLAETADNFSALDNDLLALERTPEDAAIVQRVFRVVHTIKGTSGFIGLTRLGRLTHVLENVLSELRDGQRGLRVRVPYSYFAATGGVVVNMATRYRSRDC